VSGGLAPQFLTSALDWGEWSVSRPCRFIPREGAPATHCIGGWVGPRVVWMLWRRGKSCTARNRTLAIQPIACRYTDSPHGMIGYRISKDWVPVHHFNASISGLNCVVAHSIIWLIWLFADIYTPFYQTLWLSEQHSCFGCRRSHVQKLSPYTSFIKTKSHLKKMLECYFTILPMSTSLTSLQNHHPPITSWMQPVQFMMSLNKWIIIILVVICYYQQHTEGEEKIRLAVDYSCVKCFSLIIWKIFDNQNYNFLW
jgi:hypothetical protein